MKTTDTRIINSTIVTLHLNDSINRVIRPGCTLHVPYGEEIEFVQVTIEGSPHVHECVLPDSYSWDKSQPLWSCPTDGCKKMWRIEKYYTGYKDHMIRYGWRLVRD